MSPRLDLTAGSIAGHVTGVLIAAVALAGPATLAAQNPAMPTGSITGVVSATGANGETINAPNVAVQLWTTDAATEATRDTACATWLANKTVWMQAKGEIASPSGVNWTGTAVGHDIALLNSLMALRRDTTHTDANGTYTFKSVPFGAYTVEAETFANDKFLQWSMDAPVLPGRATRIDLGPSTLAENQYCTVSSGADASGSAGDAKVYDVKELDKPLTILSGGPDPSAATPAPNEAVTISFVVDATGKPELSTVSVKRNGGNTMTVDDAKTLVAKLRYSAPMVKGVPVSARVEYLAPAASSGRRRRR